MLVFFYGAIASPTTSSVVLPFLFFFVGLRWAGQVALGMAPLPTLHTPWTPWDTHVRHVTSVCAFFRGLLFVHQVDLGGCVL